MKKLLTILFILLSYYGMTQNPSTSGYLLTRSNGAVSIGTEVNTAPLTVANFATSFPTPQTGTIIHIVSDGVTNGRISSDTYNNASIAGSIFQGRRARGTAALPTAATADDILVAIGGDGYGDDGFHNISMGGLTLRSLGTMTNASAPTYLTFSTTPTGTITQTERMRIKSDGTIQFLALNSVGFMQTDASGNLSTAALTSGNITTALGYTPVNQTTTVNGQALSSNVSITTVSGNAGTATALATGRTISGTGDATFTTGAFDGTGNVTGAVTVVKINGTTMSALATGILKNTTGTGVPSIAVAGTDYQVPITAGDVTTSGNTSTIGATKVTNAMLAGSITEAKLSITDVTTGNVTSSAHGFAPKGDGTTTKFLNANGAYSTPTGVNSTITFLSGDVTNNNASANTIADVTGLSFAVTSGVTYRFRFFIVYTSAATTTGSRWAINGPATTFVNYTSRYTLTATSETVNPGVSAYDSPAAASASSLASGNIAIIEGIIKPSANGTVIARFASEISSSAIVAKAGQSYVEFQAIN
jgi:hypothetical protein